MSVYIAALFCVRRIRWSRMNLQWNSPSRSLQLIIMKEFSLQQLLLIYPPTMSDALLCCCLCAAIALYHSLSCSAGPGNWEIFVWPFASYGYYIVTEERRIATNSLPWWWTFIVLFCHRNFVSFEFVHSSVKRNHKLEDWSREWRREEGEVVGERVTVTCLVNMATHAPSPRNCTQKAIIVLNCPIDHPALYSSVSATLFVVKRRIEWGHRWRIPGWTLAIYYVCQCCMSFFLSRTACENNNNNE